MERADHQLGPKSVTDVMSKISSCMDRLDRRLGRLENGEQQQVTLLPGMEHGVRHATWCMRQLTSDIIQVLDGALTPSPEPYDTAGTATAAATTTTARHHHHRTHACAHMHAHAHMRAHAAEAHPPFIDAVQLRPRTGWA